MMTTTTTSFIDLTVLDTPAYQAQLAIEAAADYRDATPAQAAVLHRLDDALALVAGYPRSARTHFMRFVLWDAPELTAADAFAVWAATYTWTWTR